jgi:hypothetical protein
VISVREYELKSNDSSAYETTVSLIFDLLIGGTSQLMSKRSEVVLASLNVILSRPDTIVQIPLLFPLAWDDDGLPKSLKVAQASVWRCYRYLCYNSSIGQIDNAFVSSFSRVRPHRVLMADQSG